MQDLLRNGPLLAECWLELARASVLVRLAPSRLRPTSNPADASQGDRTAAVDEAERLCLWVDRAASRHVKHMTCLERAVAAQRVIGRRGLAAELNIGVRREGDAWEAHAWLSLNGFSLDRQGEVFSAMAPATGVRGVERRHG